MHGWAALPGLRPRAFGQFSTSLPKTTKANGFHMNLWKCWCEGGRWGNLWPWFDIMKGCKWNCNPGETLVVLVSPDVVKNRQNSSLPRFQEKTSPFISERPWRACFYFNPRHICKASLMLNHVFERSMAGCHGDGGVESRCCADPPAVPPLERCE